MNPDNDRPKQEKPTPQELVRQFFVRTGKEVTADLSSSWMMHENRKEVLPGSGDHGKILVVRYPDESIRRFQIESAILYSDEYTKGRFGQSRAPQIEQMEPGTLFGYSGRGPKGNSNIYAFFKVGDIGSAENIGLQVLHETDNYGNLRTHENAEVTTANIGELLGLLPNLNTKVDTKHVLPYEISGSSGFIVDVEQQMMTAEELGDLLLPPNEQ